MAGDEAEPSSGRKFYRKLANSSRVQFNIFGKEPLPGSCQGIWKVSTRRYPGP